MANVTVPACGLTSLVLQYHHHWYYYHYCCYHHPLLLDDFLSPPLPLPPPNGRIGPFTTPVHSKGHGSEVLVLLSVASSMGSRRGFMGWLRYCKLRIGVVVGVICKVEPNHGNDDGRGQPERSSNKLTS